MLNFVLGVAASLLAAILFPALTLFFQTQIVKFLGWVPFKQGLNLRGTWRTNFHVESKRFPAENVDDKTTIRQFFNRIYVTFHLDGQKFVADGKIDRGKYVTGTWSDAVDGGYHGVFQLIVDPKSRNMSGLWIGYSTENYVKFGKWDWQKVT